MTEPTPVLIPRENVNDESATLVAWLVPSGDRVEEGQPIAQIETSKAVLDIAAPAGGWLRPLVKAGDEVAIGGTIGRIDPESSPHPDASNGSAADWPLAPSVRRLVTEEGIDPALIRGTGRGGRLTKADVLDHLAEPDPIRTPDAGPARFSAKAMALIADLGLDPGAFDGRGLVRARDVRPAPPAPSSPPAIQKPVAASGVAIRSERLPRAKRTEARYLRSGSENTLASVITVACPTRGLRASARRDPAIGDNATAILLFEVARLLRKFPVFNSYHADGDVHYYEDVNLGFAVDGGRGLKVPVIRNADRKGIGTIAAELRELVVSYLGDALSVESLAGGTFTVTDLSGEGVSSFHPLINQGQSAILGVGAEVFPPGGGEGTFHLILAFDHQLAEGRTAARFLNDLRDRLIHHEASLTPGQGATAVEVPRCARCQAGADELLELDHPLLQTVRPDGTTRLLCRPCFLGWS